MRIRLHSVIVALLLIAPKAIPDGGRTLASAALKKFSKVALWSIVIISVTGLARMLGGELRTSSETSEVRFVAPGDLHDLNIHPSMRLRIDHYWEHRPTPYIG